MIYVLAPFFLMQLKYLRVVVSFDQIDLIFFSTNDDLDLVQLRHNSGLSLLSLSFSIPG